MIVLAENHLYPIAMRAIALKEIPLQERLMAYPLILSDLVLP